MLKLTKVKKLTEIISNRERKLVNKDFFEIRYMFKRADLINIHPNNVFYLDFFEFAGYFSGI